MKLNKKITLVAVALSSALAANNAAALQGGSDITNSVQGYMPWLSSVGTKIVSGGRVEGTAPNVKTYPKVGTIIEVPTYQLEAAYDNFYNYKDKDTDKDNDAVDGRGVEVKWYILTPKSGLTWAPEGTPAADLNTSTTWVNSWDDVDVVEVNETTAPGSLVTTNGNMKSKSLKVPGSVSGTSTEDKRIGYTILPTSKTGDPRTGQLVQAFDLFYFYGQTEPSGPGPNPTTPPGPGNPGDNNPDNGGGDIRPGNEIEFTIFDTQNTPGLEDDIAVTTQNTYVNRTYRVEVLMREGDGAGTPYTYRPIEEDELKNIKWQLWETDATGFQTPANDTANTDGATYAGLRGTFAYDPVAFAADPTSTAASVARFKDLASNGSYLYFTTQETNAKAIAQDGEAVAPDTANFSEQGLSLRVVYDDGITE